MDNAWDDDRDNLQVRRVPYSVFTRPIRVPLGLLMCPLDLPQTKQKFCGYYWPLNVELTKNLGRQLFKCKMRGLVVNYQLFPLACKSC